MFLNRRTYHSALITVSMLILLSACIETNPGATTLRMLSEENLGIVATPVPSEESDAANADVELSNEGIMQASLEEQDRYMREVFAAAFLGTPVPNDTDGDLLTDADELLHTETNIFDADSDGDGINDGLEDEDGNGLTNLKELAQMAAQTPSAVDEEEALLRKSIIEFTLGIDNGDDADGDQLTDSVEAWSTFTDPTSADTDEDGIPDGFEDEDGDGLTNLEEIIVGTEPLLVDSDGNGVTDGSEDADQDGLTNQKEFSAGTDPLNPNSK